MVRQQKSRSQERLFLLVVSRQSAAASFVEGKAED
jgi:hypothetical protein